jgi:F-type H+-transporting ATPase subunit a
VTEKEEAKGFGLNRWLVVLLLVAGVFITGKFAPITPHIQLPGEPITDVLFTLPILGPFYLTNTLLATLLVDLVLFAIAFAVVRSMGDENSPPRGWANAFEAIVGALYNIVESTAGKWAKTIFPWVATSLLLILTANWLRILPIFETIGWMHEAHEGGYEARELIQGVEYIVAEEAHDGHGYEIIPFFRGSSTDLNFTAALALTTIVMVQILGVRAHGASYFSKFLSFGSFFSMWRRKRLGPFDVIMPFINIFVGILELISEFAKIVSFSFRLLGAIFGGAILFAVITTLVPMVSFGIMFLELFVGAVQALVFGMLTLVFATVATISHGDEEHGEAH